jgi:very-short-patch-repair endonuclease
VRHRPGAMRVMTQRARLCRSSETASEALLWAALRNRGLEGSRWRRQQKMGRFIVDFYCPARRLVVEIDGTVHRGREDIDAERQRMLERTGVRVARFSSLDVERDLPRVLHRLRELLRAPSPLVGEGESEGREPSGWG